MNTYQFQIDQKKIGAKCPYFIIAEIAQAHDGSLGTAHAYIDAVAEAGADAIKFQTHIAAAESTPAEPWRVKFSPQDETRYDYWQRMEFTAGQWLGLKNHANDRGLVFLSSPFSLEAVDLLEQIGIAAWKVASGEVNNLPLLERMGKSKLPIILSSGMSPIAELDKAVNVVKSFQVPFAVLQCTSAYPCPPEKVGLNLISAFKERYHCPTGLSDHSGVIFPALAAATLGGDIFEVHVTFSRKLFGPDVPASITIDELAQLVQGVRFIEKMQENPVDKDALAGEMSPLRATFNKSVVSRSALPAGTVLQAHHLTVKKPGTGISAQQLSDVIGMHLRRNVAADEILQWDDVERV